MCQKGGKTLGTENLMLKFVARWQSWQSKLEYKYIFKYPEFKLRLGPILIVFQTNEMKLI